MKLTRRVGRTVAYLLGIPGTRARLERLRERGGTTPYLHVKSGRRRFQVVLAPCEGHAERVEPGKAAVETQADGVAPDGAYVGPADRAIPLLHHLPQSEPCVAVPAA